ncbi:conserved hypothetical protein [Methylobacterium sp. 4-46]|uniref:DUF2891 domain-containing protein n=1 Tax=unclassified Methylobacterium TaxID=2615210 RepID=UPI000152C169|nr:MULTISPECIES: DUF2891 domain-containing protein [Methylobacterium]ACA15266.1 conserved hypothetical protein [Methylobacterium sp. 4-46]WFT80993.1 DUF2891 domain-containing protein [Methylobacterium nodulans]
MQTGLTPDRASRFAALTLGHVTREYPYLPGLVLTGPQDARPPAALHPIFHGSFDWHSCVHGYWLLARLLAREPAAPWAESVRTLFDHSLVPAKVAGECATLSAPAAARFERPYGWAWLLKLAEALARLPEPRWAEALAPLTALIAARIREILPVSPYPVRVGTHFNTAFALRLAADYAEGAGDSALTGRLLAMAWAWYGADAACPAWGEPSGDDFLSSALIEAECMRRLLPPERFLPWFARFLPDLAAGQPETLFRPATVADRGDGKIAHLDGLNLSRAWCLRALARALPQDDPRVPPMRAAAEAHLAASLPHLADHYMGAHWLASFAVLALEA